MIPSHWKSFSRIDGPLKATGILLNRSVRQLRFLFMAICAVVTITNLAAIYSLPSWFDEAFFANMSFNVAEGKGLIFTLIPGYHTGEVYFYGPIFFYLQSFFINLLGLDSFIFRLPILVSANLIVLLLVLVLRNNGVATRYQLLFAVAAMLDVSFNRSAVNGRMDLIAVMLISLALFLTGRRREVLEQTGVFRWLLVGAFSAMAYLVTPRSLFLLPVVLILSTYQLLFEGANFIALRNWRLITIGLVGFLATAWLWIQYTGGIAAYVELFKRNPDTASHMAVTFFRTPLANVPIVMMLILVVSNYKVAIGNVLLIGSISSYIVFSLIVKENGPYAGMITPFVLMTIVGVLERVSWTKAQKSALITVLLLPGSVHLTLRATDLYLNSGCRERSAVAAIRSQQFRNGDVIVAPYKYYFLLQGVGHDVVTLDRSKIDPTQVLAKADLLVENELAVSALPASGYVKVASLSCNIRRVPLFPSNFYERTIFNESFYRRAR